MNNDYYIKYLKIHKQYYGVIEQCNTNQNI